MNLLQRLEYWGDHHHPKWLDIVRFGLGIFLCFKGVVVLENMSTVMGKLGDTITFGPFFMSMLGHYVVFAHLLGGFLLAIGLLTRFACLIQIPILIGAIVLINAPEVLWSSFSELSLSILVLLLLCYFLIAGNGPWSFDYFIEREQAKKQK
jgi:putative oxidoreductase